MSDTSPADRRRRVISGEHAGRFAVPTTWVRGRLREYVLYSDETNPFPCDRVWLKERDLEPLQVQQQEAAS